MPDKKIVKWLVSNKKPPLIKFENDEITYKVNEALIQGLNIVKGTAVEIVAEGDIISLIKLDLNKVVQEPPKDVKEEKQPEPAKSEAKESNSEVTTPSSTQIITTTIYAVAKNKSVLKFDKEGKWIKISPELQKLDYAALGLVCHNNLKLELTDNVITKVLEIIKPEAKETPVKAEEGWEPPETEAPDKPVEMPDTNKKSEQPKQKSYRDEDIVSRRTAVMCAKDVVIAIMNQGKIDRPVANDFLENIDLTLKHYTDIFQKLINGEK